MRLFVSSVLTCIFTAALAAQAPTRQIITAGGNPALPFSPAIKAGGFIYVAGAIGDGVTRGIAVGCGVGAGETFG